MQVILKRGWFVGGNRYRSAGKSPVEIPDKYRQILPKSAVEVGRPPVEDAPEEVPNEDALEEVPDGAAPPVIPYVNPAHELDPDRAFAEAFSDVNKEAKNEVDGLRDKLKNLNRDK